MTAAAAARPAAGSSHKHWTLAACILASSLSFVEGSVLNVALPAIRASFAAGASEVQWVVNSYLLPLSALLLLGGALGDQHGRKRLLIIGTGLFAAASLLCALAPDLTWLLAGRVVQGIGAALLLPNSLGLLNATFTGEERGRAIGIWASVGAGAAAIAPLIGGWLVDHVGWAAIFTINLPLAAGAILIAARFATESRNEESSRTDYPGAVLVTLGLLGITYGLTLWSSRLAISPAIAALSLGGLALLGLFLWVEARRGDRAMMPLAMFGNRCFVGTNLLTFLLYGAFGAIMLLLPYVLIEAAGYSPLEAGLALTPLAVVIALASPLMGKLAARIGGRLPLTAGPVVVAVGMVLATRIGSTGSYAATVLPAVLVLAAGMALAVAPLTSTVLSAVDQRHSGTASGLNSAVARTGGLIATALLGAVLAARGEALVDAFHTALLIGATVSVVAAAAAWLTVAGTATPMRKAAGA